MGAKKVVHKKQTEDGSQVVPVTFIERECRRLLKPQFREFVLEALFPEQDIDERQASLRAQIDKLWHQLDITYNVFETPMEEDTSENRVA